MNNQSSSRPRVDYLVDVKENLTVNAILTDMFMEDDYSVGM